MKGLELAGEKTLTVFIDIVAVTTTSQTKEEETLRVHVLK